MNEIKMEVVTPEGGPADRPALTDETINFLGSVLAPLFTAALERQERGEVCQG